MNDLRRIGSHPDFWYPIGWSDELKRGKALGREFAGDPLVIYRGTSGDVFALEDRCAHRQVPLHLGIVKGETLKCGYHGWTYDCTGRCIDVPYRSKERLPNGVRAYPCREMGGLILIFPGNPALADDRMPTAFGSAGNQRYKTRRLNRVVNSHYSFMHENLMDMNHQVLHRRYMGSIRARCLGQRSGEDWCEVDYTFSRTAGRASIGETAILGSIRTRETGNDQDLMTIRTEYPYQDLKFWVDDGPPVLHVWLSYTPLGKDQRANRTFGYLSVRKLPIPGLIHLVWPFISWFTDRIFAQDRRIVELEQMAHDAQGSDWNNELFPAIREVRALLARCGAPSAPENQ
jgi:phenylpropionate dioxygenase-like ring-hydroxylating dioxygenase large terminal subunit